MTDYLNPHRIYPDDISRRIDTPPGFDSIRQGRGMNRQEAAEVLTALKQSLEMSDDYDYCYYSRDIDAYDTALTALRGPQPDPDTGPEGCWHCRNIEAHHIEYVIAVKAKGGTPMNMPVDCPYRYCPSCGRKLEVEG